MTGYKLHLRSPVDHSRLTGAIEYTTLPYLLIIMVNSKYTTRCVHNLIDVSNHRPSTTTSLIKG